MTKDVELIIDENLLHLEHVLLDLDLYKFDRDVIKLINELKSLVDKKLYSSIGYDDYDIAEYELKMIFHLEKMKKSVDNTKR